MKNALGRDTTLWTALTLSLAVHCTALSISRGGRAASSAMGDAVTIRMGSIAVPVPAEASNAPLPTGQAAADEGDGPARSELRERPEEGRPALERAGPAQIPAAGATRETAEGADRAPLPSPGASGRSESDGGGERGYLSLVRERIERVKRYPAGARDKAAEGCAVVRFRVARDGGVTGVRLARSSLSTLLDWEAQATVRRAAPLPPIPDEIQRDSWDLQIPITFETASRKPRKEEGP